MNYTSLDLDGLCFTKNDDGTYKGNKQVDIHNETTGMTYKSYLEYPRLIVKWMNDIEFGIAEKIDVLPVAAIGTTGSDDVLWELTIPNNDVRDCSNCANNTEPDEIDNGCYMCSKGLENSFVPIDEAIEFSTLTTEEYADAALKLSELAQKAGINISEW